MCNMCCSPLYVMPKFARETVVTVEGWPNCYGSGDRAS